MAAVKLPFSLGGAETKYALRVRKDGPFSPLERSLGAHALGGLAFSTRDQDNDQKKDSNCAKQLSGRTVDPPAVRGFIRWPTLTGFFLLSGGWWFSRCGHTNLNGRYFQSPPPKHRHQRRQGIFWKSWRGRYYPLKNSVMMIAPASILSKS